MPMVASEVLLLDQVPPGVPSVKAVVEPTHTFITPVIPDGNGVTVTVEDVIQPVGAV